MRPCRFRVGNRDQENLGEERMELKADDGKRTEPGKRGEILGDCRRGWRVMAEERGELRRRSD